MEFAGFTELTWREALIAIVALLTVYVVVVSVRIWRLRQREALRQTRDFFAAHRAVAAYTAVETPEVMKESDTSEHAVEKDAPAENEFPWNEPPGDLFSQKLELLEREIEQLRKEVGGLRAEVMVLRETQQREPAAQRVTDTVSPLYSDSMQMALNGVDAGTISQQCGISRAEAELVVALVRNSQSR